MQYTQSNTSTQPDKISSLTEVRLTQSVNISSFRRSADFRRRSVAVPSTCHIGDPDVWFESIPSSVLKTTKLVSGRTDKT